MDQNMVRYVPICKTCETSANMQDMCRYVPIYADMHDILQGMLTYIDMKKLAKKSCQYCQICRICYNMSQYAIKWRTIRFMVGVIRGDRPAQRLKRFCTY